MLERIATDAANVHWRRLTHTEQTSRYGTDQLYSARISRRYRMFTDSRNGDITIVGMVNRGSNKMYRWE